MTTDPKTLESLASDMDTAATGKGRYFIDPVKARQIADALRDYAETLPDPDCLTLQQIVEVAIRLRNANLHNAALLAEHLQAAMGDIPAASGGIAPTAAGQASVMPGPTLLEIHAAARKRMGY
jgi:hypothetical protein